MSLLSLPKTVITDAELANALGRVVQIVDPALDVVWGTDPLGLKKRTHHLGGADGAFDKAVDAVAWALNVGDVPGTMAWSEMDVHARVNWWVWRVGAVDTIAVAVPGALGVVGDRLPVQDLVGFVSQSIVLCGVAREYGISGRRHQVRLLAAVLCRRDLGADPDGDRDSGAGSSDSSDLPHVLLHLVGLFRAVADELAGRPQPRSIFRYLGMLPAVGAVVDYIGEFGALVRTAKAGQRWIAEHSDESGASGRSTVKHHAGKDLR
ncbi:hypothetical protein BH09ACT8_BH09ACT8_39820 [soil metagenome]